MIWKALFIFFKPFKQCWYRGVFVANHFKKKQNLEDYTEPPYIYYNINQFHNINVTLKIFSTLLWTWYFFITKFLQIDNHQQKENVIFKFWSLISSQSLLLSWNKKKWKLSIIWNKLSKVFCLNWRWAFYFDKLEVV